MQAIIFHFSICKNANLQICKDTFAKVSGCHRTCLRAMRSLTSKDPTA